MEYARIILTMILMGFLVSCQDQPESEINQGRMPTDQMDPRPVVLIETSMGTIKAELWADKAPLTVANFLNYVDKGFYDGLIFHRVSPSLKESIIGFCRQLEDLSIPDECVWIVWTVQDNDHIDLFKAVFATSARALLYVACEVGEDAFKRGQIVKKGPDSCPDYYYEVADKDGLIYQATVWGYNTKVLNDPEVLELEQSV